MAGLTPAHLFLVLIIALVVIGPGKLPEVGSAVGKSIREFQKASSGIQESVAGAVTHPAPPAAAPQVQPVARSSVTQDQPWDEPLIYPEHDYSIGYPVPTYVSPMPTVEVPSAAASVAEQPAVATQREVVR